LDPAVMVNFMFIDGCLPCLIYQQQEWYVGVYGVRKSFYR
jgi:hypothetical protein